jgi:hypothetical protein
MDHLDKLDHRGKVAGIRYNVLENDCTCFAENVKKWLELNITRELV